jgi:hypothetical protein
MAHAVAFGEEVSLAGIEGLDEAGDALHDFDARIFESFHFFRIVGDEAHLLQAEV